MKNSLMEALTDSISKVMETMFFLTVEDQGPVTGPPPGPDDAPLDISARLSFSGDISGSVSVIVSHELAGEMAQNFLGEPSPQLPRSQVEGTVAEMLNMVCGNALSRLSASRSFDLGLPELIPVTGLPEDATQRRIDAMIGGMTLCLQLNRP